MNNYIYIDPINKKHAGISSYIEIASNIAKNIFNIYVIKRRHAENINSFRERVFYEITRQFSYKNTIIESPDTYCSHLYFNYRWNIHVRLHGMKHIFDKINDNFIDIDNYRTDLYGVQIAHVVSAPSKIIKYETNKYIGIDHCITSPNPISPIISHTNKKNSILFIGRFQKNKGIEFLKYFFRKDIESYIFSCDSDKFRVPNYIQKFNDHNMKNELLKRSKVIIIPSYVESFSQVAVEGISNMCRIVTWDTIGISEYFVKSNIILTCPFGDINKFICNIDKAIKGPSIPSNEYEKNINICNNKYLQMLKHINRRTHFVSSIIDINSLPKNKGGKMMFTRKIKKLFRNPKQFFIDSKINTFLKKTKQAIPLQIDTHLQGNINIVSSINKYDYINNYIGKDKFIKCSENKIDFRTMNTIFFIHDKACCDLELYKYIVNTCQSINFSKPYIYNFLYKNTMIMPCNTKNIINSFTQNFKNSIANIPIVVFINPDTFLYAVFKSFFQQIKIVIILTEEFLYCDMIDCKYIDAIFMHSSLKLHKNIESCKRYAIYKDRSYLCRQLDAFSREIAPKHHNMLLKIYGDVAFDEKYLNNNSALVNCIIKIKKRNYEEVFPDYSSYIKKISQDVESILVTEDIFWEYKDIIIKAQETKDWSHFLLESAYNGVRFEIYA